MNVVRTSLFVFSFLFLVISVSCRGQTSEPESVPEEAAASAVNGSAPHDASPGGPQVPSGVVAGLALEGERLDQCRRIEEVRALTGVWPVVVSPIVPVELRSAPAILSFEENRAIAHRLNFALDDRGDTGCFINAFEAFEDGTVKDWATALQWIATPSRGVRKGGIARWIAEQNELSIGGYDDWRVPTLEELASLIDQTRYGSESRIDLDLFEYRGRFFWTADRNTDSGSDELWVIDFSVAGSWIPLEDDQPRNILAVRSLSHGGR